MSHWSDAFVGLPWVEGVFDCAHLAGAVRADVFHQPIRLPTHRDYPALSGFARIRAMKEQVATYKDDYAERIKEEDAVDGDGVLLISRGKPDHIGILCLINGARWILHAAAGPNQVARTRVRELELYGYSIEGWYKWK